MLAFLRLPRRAVAAAAARAPRRVPTRRGFGSVGAGDPFYQAGVSSQLDYEGVFDVLDDTVGHTRLQLRPQHTCVAAHNRCVRPAAP
eukprot:gene30471-10446_t